jgi:hypothetical protein
MDPRVEIGHHGLEVACSKPGCSPGVGSQLGVMYCVYSNVPTTVVYWCDDFGGVGCQNRKWESNSEILVAGESLPIS